MRNSSIDWPTRRCYVTGLARGVDRSLPGSVCCPLNIHRSLDQDKAYRDVADV